MTFKSAAQIARLAANNNTHLQLASSNTFRSHIVLRQPAVQNAQLARTTPFFCAGRISGRNQMQEKNSKNLQKFGENGEQQARKHLQAYRKRDGSKRLQIWKKFSTTSSAKEASSERAASSRKNMTRSGFGLTRPAWALAYGFPRAPTTSPRAKAPRWREGSSKADRGQRLRGPWLRGPASHDANGIRRARRPGPIRRPLCCEQATDPARLWPQGRKREIYE